MPELKIHYKVEEVFNRYLIYLNEYGREDEIIPLIKKYARIKSHESIEKKIFEYILILDLDNLLKKIINSSSVEYNILKNEFIENINSKENNENYLLPILSSQNASKKTPSKCMKFMADYKDTLLKDINISSLILYSLKLSRWGTNFNNYQLNVNLAKFFFLAPNEDYNEIFNNIFDRKFENLSEESDFVEYFKYALEIKEYAAAHKILKKYRLTYRLNLSYEYNENIKQKKIIICINELFDSALKNMDLKIINVILHFYQDDHEIYNNLFHEKEEFLKELNDKAQQDDTFNNTFKPILSNIKNKINLPSLFKHATNKFSDILITHDNRTPKESFQELSSKFIEMLLKYKESKPITIQEIQKFQIDITDNLNIDIDKQSLLNKNLDKIIMKKIKLSPQFKQYLNDNRFLKGCLLVGFGALAATAVLNLSAASPLIIAGATVITQVMGITASSANIVQISSLILGAVVAVCTTVGLFKHSQMQQNYKSILDNYDKLNVKVVDSISTEISNFMNTLNDNYASNLELKQLVDELNSTINKTINSFQK